MFRTLGTILKWAILLPVLLAIVLLAVANDQTATINLNPFDANDPVLRLELALYQVCFVFFVAGALIGGLIVWIGQGKYRKRARDRRAEAELWQARSEWSESRRAPAEPTQANTFLPRPERG